MLHQRISVFRYNTYVNELNISNSLTSYMNYSKQLGYQATICNLHNVNAQSVISLSIHLDVI